MSNLKYVGVASVVGASRRIPTVPNMFSRPRSFVPFVSSPQRILLCAISTTAICSTLEWARFVLPLAPQQPLNHPLTRVHSTCRWTQNRLAHQLYCTILYNPPLAKYQNAPVQLNHSNVVRPRPRVVLTLNTRYIIYINILHLCSSY